MAARDAPSLDFGSDQNSRTAGRFESACRKSTGDAALSRPAPHPDPIHLAVSQHLPSGPRLCNHEHASQQHETWCAVTQVPHARYRTHPLRQGTANDPTNAACRDPQHLAENSRQMSDNGNNDVTPGHIGQRQTCPGGLVTARTFLCLSWALQPRDGGLKGRGCRAG